jgi:chromosome segregation ATPase
MAFFEAGDAAFVTLAADMDASRELFGVLSACVLHKKYDDEARLREELEAADARVVGMKEDTRSQLQSEWAAVSDGVQQMRRANEDEVRGVRQAARDAAADLDDRIRANESKLADLLSERVRLENELAYVTDRVRAAEATKSSDQRSVGDLRAARDRLTSRLRATEREVSDMRAAMAVDSAAHDAALADLGRLLGDTGKRKADLDVAASDVERGLRNEQRRGVELDARARQAAAAATVAQATLADRQERSGGLRAELSSIQAAISALSTPDAAEAVQQRAEALARLERLQAELRAARERVADRTDKIVDAQAGDDLLRPRIAAVRTEVERLQQARLPLDTAAAAARLQAIDDENDSIRAELRGITLDPVSYMSAMLGA